MINVVCVLKQGGKVGYDASWVDKLQNAVRRNLTLPHRFICLSDCEVNCERIPIDSAYPGFWSKLQLFQPGLFTGPVFYLDLDTVICQNIDDMFEPLTRSNFVMWYEADKDIHSSAMMWWQSDQSHLWDRYQTHPPKHWSEKYKSVPLYGDQGFISEHVEHELFTDLLPTPWFHIVSKHDNELDLSQVKILHFRKVQQKPSTMLAHPLVAQHWI
jgi:hypothetical protein